MSAKEVKSLEETLKALVLHKGCWAFETPKGLYVFPAEITKEEALKVITDAYEYNKTKLN